MTTKKEAWTPIIRKGEGKKKPGGSRAMNERLDSALKAVRKKQKEVKK